MATKSKFTYGYWRTDKAKEEGFWSTKVIYSSRKEGNVDYVRPDVEETKEVECRYLNEGYVFINCRGDVIPCCYWNSDHLEAASENYIPLKDPSKNRYLELWKEHGGQLATNMKYNEIAEVIEGDFFDAVAESWTQQPLLNRCEHFCKKKKQNIFKKTKI